MIAVRRVLALSGLAIAVALCSVTALHAAQPAGVEAVHAADDAWVKAYNAGQLENVVALYAEDATLYPPGVAPVRGRAAIHAFFEGDMAGFAKTGLLFALGEHPDGGVSGDMGWSAGTWTLKDKTGQVVDTGWYFSVSRRVGGKWLYVRDSWNSDKPAAPAAPAAK